jgi:hypothetical protein
MRHPSWIAVALIGFVGTTGTLGQGTTETSPSYDAKAEIVLKGKVSSVAAIPDWMGRNGVNVTLETPESVMVHVDTAPAEFLKMLDFALVAGDDLEVLGVWAKWDGHRVFLARTMTRDRVAVSVRDPQGRPIW